MPNSQNMVVLPDDVDHISLEELLDRYVAYKVLRPATVKHYRNILSLMMSDCGIRYLDEVSLERMTDWKNMVLERASLTTWNTYHRSIRALLNYCVRLRLIDENPMTILKQSSRGNRRGRSCPEEDFRGIVQYLREEDSEPTAPFVLKIVLTFYYTGMRRAQLCGLQWGDVDFRQGRIHLRKEYSKNGREWSIPMHKDLQEELLDLRGRLLTTGIGLSPEDQVFWVQRLHPHFVGDRMSPEQLGGLFRRLSRRSGIRISPHPIRHLVASTLANQHVNRSTDIPASLATVKDLLGHSDLKTTMGYIESDLSAQREILQGLRALRS